MAPDIISLEAEDPEELLEQRYTELTEYLDNEGLELEDSSPHVDVGFTKNDLNWYGGMSFDKQMERLDGHTNISISVEAKDPLETRTVSSEVEVFIEVPDERLKTIEAALDSSVGVETQKPVLKGSADDPVEAYERMVFGYSFFLGDGSKISIMYEDGDFYTGSVHLQDEAYEIVTRLGHQHLGFEGAALVQDSCIVADRKSSYDLDEMV